MSEQKHTPGPWDVFGAEDSSSGKWRALTVAEASMPFMRVCFMPSDGTETIIANARLIAAAPELLEALRKAEFRLAKLMALNDEEPGIASPDDAVALEQVRSAIAKAEGRSWEAARAAIDAATR